MAEKAAHTTSYLQAKPSIFEVIAQESFAELLYPSFKIIIQFLGSNNPQRFHWLNEWSEEVFLGINSILQLHYLNNKEASFSESFYGLKRVFNQGYNGKLSAKTKFWSLFCLVGLPYIAHKLEQWVSRHQNLKVGQVTGACFKMVVASWRAVSLVQYLRYLTGTSEAHSPLLSVADLSFQYCSEEPDTPISWSECFSSPRACARLVSGGLTQGLEVAAFFLQCLQWWHSDEQTHEKLASTIPPPPPSITDVKKSDCCICPICKEPCKIETALMTSGYVFCYRCIREAVVTNQQCPVTGLPTTLDELIRLYPTR